MYEATAVGLQPIASKGKILILGRGEGLGHALRSRYFQVTQIDDAENAAMAVPGQTYDLVLIEEDLPSSRPEIRQRIEAALPGVPIVKLAGAPPSENADLTIDTLESQHIGRVLGLTHGNYAKTARLLGIDRTTLYNKVKRYGLSR
jgi:DNA-binding NtrC family response regulator